MQLTELLYCSLSLPSSLFPEEMLLAFPGPTAVLNGGILHGCAQTSHSLVRLLDNAIGCSHAHLRITLSLTEL